MSDFPTVEAESREADARTLIDRRKALLAEWHALGDELFVLTEGGTPAIPWDPTRSYAKGAKVRHGGKVYVARYDIDGTGLQMDPNYSGLWAVAVDSLPPIPIGGGEPTLRFEDGVDASIAVRDWIDGVCEADLKGRPPGPTNYHIRTLTFSEDDGGAVIYSRNNMVRAAGMIVRDTHNFSVAMRMFGDDLPSPATGGDPISTAPTDGTLIDIWVEGPGSRWVQDCRWGKPIGANWGDRYGDDVGMADQWVTSAGFSLDRRNGVAAAWRLPSSATGGVETGAVEARAQELFASWRNDNGLICDADVSGHIPMKSGNYVFCSGCGESLTRRQVDMIARAKNDNQRASPPAVVSPAPTGEPVALDDLQAAFDEQFHAEWQAQYKSSMKRLGKVAMASEPFFNIARKLFASPVPIAGPTKEEILAAIEAAEDAVMLSRLEAGHPKRDACRSLYPAEIADAILALFNGVGR